MTGGQREQEGRWTGGEAGLHRCLKGIWSPGDRYEQKLIAAIYKQHRPLLHRLVGRCTTLWRVGGRQLYQLEFCTVPHCLASGHPAQAHTLSVASLVILATHE